MTSTGYFWLTQGTIISDEKSSDDKGNNKNREGKKSWQVRSRGINRMPRTHAHMRGSFIRETSWNEVAAGRVSLSVW